MATLEERWAVLWARKHELQADRRRLQASARRMEPRLFDNAMRHLAAELLALEKDLRELRAELVAREEGDTTP